MAYAIPVIQDLQSQQPKIQRHDGPIAMVIVPTREVSKGDIITNIRVESISLNQPMHLCCPGRGCPTPMGYLLGIWFLHELVMTLKFDFF